MYSRKVYHHEFEFVETQNFKFHNLKMVEVIPVCKELLQILILQHQKYQFFTISFVQLEGRLDVIISPWFPTHLLTYK